MKKAVANNRRETNDARTKYFWDQDSQPEGEANSEQILSNDQANSRSRTII